MGIILKNKEQIDGIRKSSELAAKTLKHLEKYVSQGIKTIEINQIVKDFFKQNNAISATEGYKSYKHACCVSPNDVICHGVPNDYEIKFGDIVNVDVTPILNGYYGDTCKMYSIGEITPYAQKLLNVTKECLRLGIQECYPGNRLGNIGYVINELANANGYSVVTDFCGHGVGIHFHEDPQVEHKAKKDSGPILKPGMTFTIEPMINAGKPKAKVDRKDGWTARTADGRLSAQYEHTILITENGCEVLTDVYGDF